MANRAEAYDLSYFEDKNAVIDDYSYGYYSAAEQPEIEQEPEEKVVELPRRRPHREPEKHLRPKRSPLRMAAASMCFLLIFAASVAAVYSEVQLTELTEKINQATSDLEEAESLEVQLTMRAAQRMSDAEIEQYAVEQLGMGKLNRSQVVYLHVAQQDKGTVVQEAGGGSWLDGLLSELRGLFAQ